ncbi:MAG: hypothetical protein AB6733_08655 [Clostridiaceae bacterium]
MDTPDFYSWERKFDKGIKWDVKEGGWTGLWSREGSTDTFRGRWVAPGEKAITADLTIRVEGNKVTVQRRNSSDGNNCNYQGTIAPNGIDVRGTYSCDQGGGQWTAKIRRINLGSVWQETEGAWTGTWERERNSRDTFTASWRSSTESGVVYAKLKMETDGYEVTIRRYNSSDGNNCIYNGRFNSTNEMYVSGSRKCDKGGGQWSAQILR